MAFFDPPPAASGGLHAATERTEPRGSPSGLAARLVLEIAFTAQAAVVQLPLFTAQDAVAQ
jgi:hypothetical protein